MKKLTKEQKVYVSILLVAVMCLAADRLFFGPSEATAGSSSLPPNLASGSSLPGTATNLSTSQSLAGQRSSIEIAKKLSKAAKEQQLAPEVVPDIFSPAWLQIDSATTVTPTTETTPKFQTVADRFLNEHKLNAIMGTSPGGSVIVNGTHIRIGQEISGFQLVVVKKRSAIFEREGTQVELRLPEIDLTDVSSN